ncbi:GINS complex subunit [Ascosphaera aggregata]|nr:GINS complex subunit [Ascosphaera aggregata]
MDSKMDIDIGIDDILASVDRPDLYSGEAAAVDHQQLTRFWVAERGVPEVLPWPEKLMDRVLERVRRQIDIIEEMASIGAEYGLDMGDMTAVAQARNHNNPTNNLKLSILQSDLSRTQYLIRSILRQRLSKMTKYPIHYLRLSSEELPLRSQSGSQSESQSQSQTQTQTTQKSNYTSHKPGSILSPSEHSFLLQHHTLLSSHYSSSFLSYFPDKLTRLDDTTGSVSMVEVPETREIVFARCLAPEVRLVVPLDEEGVGGEVWSEGYVPGERIEGMSMRRGEIWMVRWEGVRDAWRKGDIEVL